MSLDELRETRVGYAVKRAFHAQRVTIDGVLREFGITTAQWAALMCLHYQEGLSSADLARFNDCTPQTMNSIILHLEAVGLVERYRHPRHGTLLPARLTPAGEELLARCTARVEAVEARVLAGFDADERRQLIGLLNRYTEALQREAGETTGDPGERMLDAAQHA
jgi:DNA-binding MarR family transcriptional regulator